ncbi:MAG: HAD hydrolase-like protein, partial [Lachnospiraceae bacterium]|nr:HAD hydrolase-like protein [Lachnospiraceae bacterium]
SIQSYIAFEEGKLIKYAFFDLDGTLTQPEFGILASFRYALSKFGIELNSREDELRLIGPPLYNSFTDFYGFDEEKATEAIKYYREYYTAGGMFDAPLYDGIYDTCLNLKENGVKLVVVTSKPQIYAEQVVAYFELDKVFDRVVGPLAESKVSNKAFLIKRAIEEEGISDLSSVIMLGDRKYDIEAANEVGVASMGASYGYGSVEELENANATYIVNSPSEILIKLGF